MPTRDVVVIGASAGGVEALKQLVSHLPDNLPATLLIVLHIAPHSPGLLPSILTRAGRLPVVQASDGAMLQKSYIYVAAPDHHLLLDDGHMRLVRGPRENLHRPAIDPLFRTAARACGRRTVGVVLSGSQDDGTAGLRAIKSVGGVTIAQDPDEALFPDMPRSAITLGNADYVLPVKQIAAKLTELAHEPLPAEAGSVSDLINYESQMDSLQSDALETSERPGTPSQFACPECGGVLWELHEGEMVRYRCRVGHALTVNTLLNEQVNTLETALWAALTTLEENISLCKYMAERARRRGHEQVARGFDAQRAGAEARAELIRQALLAREAYPSDIGAQS